MTSPAPNAAPANPAARMPAGHMPAGHMPAGHMPAGQLRAPMRLPITHQSMRPPPLPPVRPLEEPFRSAEEAWFWTMAGLRARRDGARSTANLGRTRRPCELDDVVKCLDDLYRHRRIALVHARILRVWGERQTAPNPAYATERADWRLWREALERLEWPLRVKGIVA